MKKKSKGKFYILFFIVKAISLLPLWFFYILSDIIYFIGYYLIGYRKKVVTQNLTSTFPEKSGKEIHQIRRKFYRNLSDWMVESIKGQSMSERNFLKRMKVVEGLDIVNELLSQGRSIIAMNAHLINWEWLCITPKYYISKSQTFSVFQPATNIEFTDLQNRMRARFGITTVSMKDILPCVVRNNQNNVLGVYYFFADQAPPANNPFWTTFLNHETAFFLGGEKIASKFGYAVVFMDVQKVKRGHYEIAFKLISENAKGSEQFEITTKYARILEEHINAHPENWLWSHRRWKRNRPENIPLC